MFSRAFSKESSLFLEVTILMFSGLILSLLGILLHFVYARVLPYYEEGVFGLFFVVCALQIISMGKTPLGDLKRSVYVLFIGGVIALFGIITCMIPGLFGDLPKYLLIALFSINGIVQLVRLFYDEDKYSTWKKYGGIFTHLIIACVLTYTFSLLLAIFIVLSDLLPPLASAIVMLYGIILFYLAVVLQKMYSTYPPKKTLQPGELDLSVPNIMLLLIGMFMITLGIALIPVSFGLIPFAAHAQLGLLVTFFAIQIITIGNTPIGEFRRTNFLIGVGFVLAIIGVTSCIIPDILTDFLVLLVGALNIIGGALTLGKMLLPLLMNKREKIQTPKIMLKVFVSSIILNVLTIIFGFSMLISNLIPVLVVGIILALNGFVLLYLMSLLIQAHKMENGTFAKAAV